MYIPTLFCFYLTGNNTAATVPLYTAVELSLNEKRYVSYRMGLFYFCFDRDFIHSSTAEHQQPTASRSTTQPKHAGRDLDHCVVVSPAICDGQAVHGRHIYVYIYIYMIDERE